MAEPVILAAAAFFAVIVLGSVLVGINDWLEARHAVAVAGGGGGRGRSSTTVRPTGRRRQSGNTVRMPLLMAASGHRRPRRARMAGDWY